LYLSREWNTLLPIAQYSESISDTNEYEVGFGKNKNTFPYDLESYQKKKSSNNFKLLKSTPYGNTFTKDFAVATILNEDLGKDENTDFLVVSFSSTDYIGDKFGPLSVEVEDAFLRLDKEIAHLITFIDEQIGKENVLVFLTSDHGGAHIPKYLKDINIPAGYFKYHYSIALLKSYLNAIYGEGDWVMSYVDQQIYLNRNLIEDSNLSLEEFQTKVANFMLQYSGVANAITSSTLQTNNFTGGFFEKMQNSFNQKRSGDVIINLEPGWIQDKLDATDQNSGYNYDTHVPLIWYGWKIKRSSVLRRISIANIAPTISNFLNISNPNGCNSDPIKELSE